ncbi:maleylacetate reductase [Streptomyces sp. NPDC015171]|uniref:maleylacetate reductase n=1 Tax=Streptomyces sp. NPDC015171 TaxID=3364945 RepID=UPI003701D35E
MRFEHETLPQRVYFGSGGAADAVGAEAARLGAARVMVIASASGAGPAEKITARVPVVVRHDEAVTHVPVAAAERARAAATAHAVDLLVSVGGGAATGLAKAVALTTGIPIVAVPTTYAGSEATSVWGLTEGARKTTGSDPRVLPRAIVYDASLTLSLPVPMSVASGLNALAHCVDSFWAPRTDPVDRALAGEGIRALAAGLPAVVADPGGLDGREQVLYAAYLSALAFSSAGSGLHHRICHVLGGRYGLPHAQAHAVVLPYVLAFNAPAAPEAERGIAGAFGAASAVEGLRRLRSAVDAPVALRDHGFREADVEDAVPAVLEAVPAGNPRPVTAEDVRRMLRAAWQGADPLTAA